MRVKTKRLKKWQQLRLEVYDMFDQDMLMLRERCPDAFEYIEVKLWVLPKKKRDQIGLRLDLAKSR